MFLKNTPICVDEARLYMPTSFAAFVVFNNRQPRIPAMNHDSQLFQASLTEHCGRTTDWRQTRPLRPVEARQQGTQWRGDLLRRLQEL